MKKSIQIITLLSLITWLQTSCTQPDNPQYEVAIMIRDSLKQEYAPDKRVAMFNVDVQLNGEEIVLEGETNLPGVKRVFELVLKQKGIEVKNNIVELPDESVGANIFALVNNSVANLRSKPKHSAELATQALLGQLLMVLKIQGEWYLVQSMDGYIAWVDHGGVVLKSQEEINGWGEYEKIIVNSNYNVIYKTEDFTEVLCDVTLGSALSVLSVKDDSYEVILPDQRIGYVKKEGILNYNRWSSSLNPSGSLVVQYAKSLMGVPYLWGGTSSKGVDCSGFTKMAYLMNGLVIQRDASQQVNDGKVVDQQLKFEGLEQGDLMFFGKKATDSTRQRVNHVALWIGDGEFIHASRNVRMSSIDPDAANFDEFNKNRYLGSRRYLGELPQGW